MLLAIADENKMKALLSAKGFQPAPNARFKALPRCRVYYLFWRGHAERFAACLFTSLHLPVLTVNGRMIPVTVRDLAELDMIEAKGDDI